jgi:hypothetical protein
VIAWIILESVFEPVEFLYKFLFIPLMTSETGVMYYLIKKINKTILQNVCLELK